MSVPISHSDQKFCLGHENISMQDDPDLWPCKDVVSINLPFPVQGSILSILPQCSMLVLVMIQLCSRGARGAGHVPTAQLQIECSAGTSLDTLPVPGHRVGVIGAAGSLSAWFPGWKFATRLQNPVGAFQAAGCQGLGHLPARKADLWWWLSPQPETLLTPWLLLGRILDLPQGRCGWTWSLFSTWCMLQLSQ